MQSIRTPRTQAVRRVNVYTVQDIVDAERRAALARGIENGLAITFAIVLGAAAVWIVAPQVLAATAGMP